MKPSQATIELWMLVFGMKKRIWTLQMERRTRKNRIDQEKLRGFNACFLAEPTEHNHISVVVAGARHSEFFAISRPRIGDD